MAGRRPKPTILKIASGGKPLNLNEPKPEVSDGLTIATLSKEGQRWWDYFVPILQRIKVLTEADHLGLAHLCQNAGLADTASKDIAKRGMLIEGNLKDRQGRTKGTVLVPNPSIRIQAEAMRQVRIMLIEFGLTPSSRTKVTKTVQPEQLKRDPVGDIRSRMKRAR